ncbi:MAG: penicillin-binding protein activator [Pseudomonadota bacterium]
MQKRIIIFALAALLFGCAESPTVRQPAPDRQPDRETLAEQAMQSGQYGRAAELYGRLAAKARPPASYRHRYREAQALFQDGSNNLARDRLDSLASAPLPERLRLEAQLLRAEIDLQRNPDHTLSLLSTPAVDEDRLPDSNALYARYHELRARAFSALSNHLEAAREYILRDLYLQDEQTIRDNQLAIWQALSAYGPETLERLQVEPPRDTMSGWLELVLLAKDYSLSPNQVEQRLTQWRQRYPGHPASEAVLEEVLARSHELAERPARLALLLPHSGRFAAAARAIQEGLLAAYYSDPQRHDITLNIYDAGEEPAQLDRAYAEAVADGAQFIIGPLNKEAVAHLAAKEALPIPTLALNRAEQTNNAQLYQFGLAPEDEAREVAERAWAVGHRRAALLLPQGELGDRLAHAFNEHWQALGGSVAGQARYDRDDNDFSTPIKTLLNLNDSEFRKRRLNQLMSDRVEFTPRRRQDVDFVFLFAYPRQARLIRPQLDFHHASQLPVLATSHLYTGQIDRDTDRDMDNIAFCDMPWTLGGESTTASLRREYGDLLQAHGGQLQRLVALGIDAYQLVPLLPMLANHPYDHYQGETGRLSLDQQRRVERGLQWATFRRGVPWLEQERIIELNGTQQQQE